MTNIVREVAELAQLWPALGDALGKDQSPTYGDRVSISSDVEAGLPVNLDVAEAIRYLAQQIPAAAAYARRLLAEPPFTNSIDAMLAHDFTRWHGRLVDLGDQDHADLLAQAVTDWLGRARVALGLTIPDRHLGQMCPGHDDPLVELVEPGATADLRHATRTTAAALTWTRTTAVYCRWCRNTWTPGPGYLALDRELKTASRRRDRTSAAAA